MANGPEKIFAERAGRMLLSDLRFFDESHLLDVIQEIIGPLGRRIDRTCPMVDARLADGSRVNAAIPPVALDGPYLTIRKFPSVGLTIKQLLRTMTLNKKVAAFLKLVVEANLNVVVSGGSGTGIGRTAVAKGNQPPSRSPPRTARRLRPRSSDELTSAT